MSGLILPQSIFCDEAGFTGNRLLDAQQPFFTYSSVAIAESKACEIVATIRRKFRLQARELKGSQLMRTARGREAAMAALAAMRNSYLVTAYDKKLSLACKFFEYIFEPVLAANNSIFYQNSFHRFIATLVYVNFLCKEAMVVDIVTQFENFMRSLNPKDAPLIFETEPSAIDIHESLKDIVSFIAGYRDIILRESHGLGTPAEAGGSAPENWVLDLTLSALWSHLGYWGEKHPLLDVLCDDSKPLRTLAPVLDIMVNRPNRVTAMIGGKVRPMTFNLARSVALGSSSANTGLQLADVASSALLQALRRRDEEWSQAFLDELQPHVHEDCIMPDLDHMDLGKPGAAVNALILRELGERASHGRDPLKGMAKWYAIGQESAGEFLSGKYG